VTLRVAAARIGVERIEARKGKAVLTFAPSTPVTPERILNVIARSKGAMVLKKEYTIEARIADGPWPAVRDGLTRLLGSLA
jgi:transcription-repair coupling factor (superfamily II helicase)